MGCFVRGEDPKFEENYGVWRSPVSARRSGRRGRRFKSSHPDKIQMSLFRYNRDHSNNLLLGNRLTN